MSNETTATLSNGLHHAARHRIVLLVMRVLVILLSLLLIAYITYDSLENTSFIADPGYMRLQLWICIFFIVDIIAEWMLSGYSKRTLFPHIFMLVICIPYLNIISYYHIDVSYEMQYILRFIPIIRAAYILVTVSGLISSNWVTSMFSIYIIFLLFIVYFASLMFFVAEHYINPLVDNYGSAIWWTIMDMSTCGSNINPMTPTGKVLAVILSAGGLIFFPVFTVYITNALTHKK